MAYDEHDHPASEGGRDESTAAAIPHRSAARRKRVLVGVAGAAAVLTGAGLLITQLMNEQQSRSPEPAALAPQTTPATAGSVPSEAVPSVTRTPEFTKKAAPVERRPAPSSAASRPASLDPGGARASVAIDEMRERLGMPEPLGMRGAQVTERTEALADGSIRILTADRDLSGEPPLLAAGSGEPVGGGVRCTGGLRYGTAVPSPPAAALVCWRTSASRSVITVASATEDGSLAAESVEVITREWARSN